VLIFAQATEDPIYALEGMVFRGAESKAALDVLDHAVAEQRELHDPRNDLIRAPERYRVLEALRRCLETERHQGRPASDARCLNIDLTAVVGIKRSELAAALGPATWCQRSDPLGYVPGAGGDCEAQQTPLWSSESTSTAPGGLMCQYDESDRCMHVVWIRLAQ